MKTLACLDDRNGFRALQLQAAAYREEEEPECAVRHLVEAPLLPLNAEVVLGARE
eukprot:CAMPEP_0115154132 /NCGR_PEP_ID=MMETSP0227-20121206/67110_1 /TAXON_ID=89957 /ORGANISM="Polarella glacialis, Strain CCMP 1383" /LENGTH=54 /DNA_ID=CAMNT_0002564945 /DNA_START=443 /DNA_END=604 /DNA_ORIENTATION=-